MFKYVSDVSNLYHNIITSFIEDKNVAIDATLGNGHDCDFLSELFEKVYAFDIQDEAVNSYKSKNKEKVEVILDSHENFELYIKEENVDCIVYNLGYLPGNNKEVTTVAHSTLKSIEIGLDLLGANGLMIIALYSGHEEGKIEKQAVLDFTSTLPKNKYGVLYTEFTNRAKSAPSLVVIEKKFK
ncbi:rRNA methylase [Clostridium perfringens]|nr:rRNA methylase [Clostridium perfringens]